jgi:hypothetical protein
VQLVYLPAELNSLDPDYPDDSDALTYQWFCRVISPTEEKYNEFDEDGYPRYNDARAQGIPQPNDPVQINTPPGCFGKGAGPLKKKSGSLRFSTTSFITFAQVYEITLVLSKGAWRKTNY